MTIGQKSHTGRYHDGLRMRMVMYPAFTITFRGMIEFNKRVVDLRENRSEFEDPVIGCVL